LRACFFIGFLLISFIGIADETLAVKGEFRLGLPRPFSSAQVLFVLRQSGDEGKQNALAYQSNIVKDGQKLSINLEYDRAKVDFEKQYNIDVFVRELLTEEQRLILKDSFLLDTFNNIYIAINVPPQPIE